MTNAPAALFEANEKDSRGNLQNNGELSKSGHEKGCLKKTSTKRDRNN